MKKYTLSELLTLVEKKFNVKFSPSLKLLTSLRPLLPAKERPQQNQIFENIRTFFLTRGKEYLESEIK